MNNYNNENEQKNDFLNNVGDSYNSWTKPWLQKIDNEAVEVIKKMVYDEKNVSIANQCSENIEQAKNEIEQQFKNQKIKSKKVANGFIIFFSILIIGLFFLYFLVKNKKIIKNFDKFKEEKELYIDNQNNLKTSAFYNIFGKVKRNEIVDQCLNGSGIKTHIRPKGSDMEQILHDISKSYTLIELSSFKLNGQNIYVTNAAYEYWEDVTTSGSEVVYYTTKVKTSDGYVTETHSDVVYAYHNEPTPFRIVKTFSILGFDNSASSFDCNFDLSANDYDSKKEKNIDHLKTKKIAKSKSKKKENILNFENQKFNIGYDVYLQNNTGSIEDEQAILSWFSPGTQEKFVDLRDKLIQDNKLDLLKNKIIKYHNMLIVVNSENVNSRWFSDYNCLPLINTSITDTYEKNINNLALKFKSLMEETFVTVSSLVNFLRISTHLTLNPIQEDYSLYDPLNKRSDNLLDTETIISIGNEEGCFNSLKGVRLPINTVKTILFNKQPKYSTGEYEVYNYLVTNEIDVVRVYHAGANRYVSVDVPYERYHNVETIVYAGGIDKKYIKDVIQLQKNIIEKFNQMEIDVYLINKSDYLYFYTSPFINRFRQQEFDSLNEIIEILISKEN